MKTIFISAGHSMTDSGAVALDGTKEADVAVELRNIVAFYLKRSGYKVLTDGLNKENYALRDAIKLINKSDFAVEIHCNAFSNPAAKGVEVLAGSNHKAVSKSLASSVSDSMGIPIRGSEGGYKTEGSGQHSRLGFIRAGGVILETFFISNPSELATYKSKCWLIGRSIAEAITKHY